MIKTSDPFVNILPQLDVHGYTWDTVMTVVNEFIEDNVLLGNKKIGIIHGKGNGILKDKIHHDLSKNKLVNKYYLYAFNLGLTIIELNIN